MAIYNSSVGGWGSTTGILSNAAEPRPSIQCDRCRAVFMKGLTGSTPVTRDEVIVAAHLAGWFVTEKEKHCLKCVQEVVQKMNDHIKNATKIQTAKN
jgi:hypothetical protein